MTMADSLIADRAAGDRLIDRQSTRPGSIGPSELISLPSGKVANRA
jgi:hypothetical protein